MPVARDHHFADDRVLAFCSALGRALVGRRATRVVVMTGGRAEEPAADRAVVEDYARRWGQTVTSSSGSGS